MKTNNDRLISFTKAHKKILISLSAFLLYMLCFLLLYNRAVWAALTLAVVPLFLFAYFYKLKYSIILCTALNLVIILLLKILEENYTITDIFSVASRIGIICSYLIVIVTGIISAMNGKLKKEITARKAAESAVQQKWEYIKEILDTIVTGIVLIKADERIIEYANPEACNIIGLPAGEIIGKDCITVLFNKQTDLYPAAGIGMKGESRERIFTRADGTQIPIIGAMTWKHIHGVDYLLDSFQDLSYIKQIHNNLLDLQKKVIQAERLASIGRMAAGMAHEINNPLAFIISNCNNIKKYIDIFKEFFDLVHSLTEREKIFQKEKELNLEYNFNETVNIFRENEAGFKRIIDIMDSLKDFDKLNSPALLTKIDFNKLIADVIFPFSSNSNNPVSIFQQWGKIPLVYCNPNDLNIVFYNIILNAHQAAENTEKPEISISTSHVADAKSGGDVVVCTISDNGPGIEEAYLDKIFEPFFTLKDVGGGKGLGLTIAYDIIVNKYIGEISAKNRPGGGAEFTIRIPVESPRPAREE